MDKQTIDFLSNLSSDDLEAMCRAHDAEEAAIMGEPSPWTFVNTDGLVDADWVSGRLIAMRLAVLTLIPKQT